MPAIERALISVSDKTGIIDLAHGLAARAVEIISTGGTARAIREAGIAVTPVEQVTGFPEMMDGRVKTLHPKIHGGLLALRDNPAHLAALQEHGITPIDLLVVNLYPFEATTARPDCTFEDAIENIDIGGPAMLRSAAKNHRDVAVVVDPADYPVVLDELTREGDVQDATRRRLARKVFAHTSRYDGLIADYLAAATDHDPLPEQLTLRFQRRDTLRYGENPHQSGAVYVEPGYAAPCVARGKVLQGKAMSYNNYQDANSALELVRELPPISCAIIKHNNPCGAATAATVAEAYDQAKECDPISAFGGVVAVNQVIDGRAAHAIAEIFTEVIIAPGFDPAAREVFAAKKNLRLLEVGPLGNSPSPGLDYKRIVGGLILQDRDLGTLEQCALKVVTQRAPTNDEMAALRFAWVVCKHVKSNAIILTRADRTIGIGAGQMSRVDSTRLAAMKAASDTKGCALASDAFFPFRDGIDAAAEAGATSIIQPGGSIRDAEVIAAADEHGMAMVFTGMRHFRH
jgi:phosphoribosylaminoimidazolecarboxamide formyltransferase/IMP cyclohydrolase